MIVEICTTTVSGALMAQNAGADRIELCVGLETGGLTPSYGLISSVMEQVDLPVHVLIRPHVGGFVANAEDLDLMIRDIDVACRLGAAGVVIGALTPDFEVDQDAITRMIQAADGRWVTFHRAFDWVKDPLTALAQIEKLGINALLTSGQKPTAAKGFELLKTLLDQATTDLQIMPGGGVNAQNAGRFKAAGFKAIHGSASVLVRTLDASGKLPLQEHLAEGVVRRTSLENIENLIRTVKAPSV
jgi:copper homeostasis protein|tara:strand:+ start:13816 stop:14547 length:732 start_codon:yes stop_codon:yes gene_type:complete